MRSFDRILSLLLGLFMKDIQIVNIDYTSVNPKFKCKETVEIAKIPAPWIIPEEGPFYEDSVRLRNGGTYLNPGSDYFFVEPATDLTEMTGKGVSLYIELKPHILSTVVTLDLEYQKVGDPTISRAKLIKALEDMFIHGADIDFENQITNKPATYYPAKHSMDVSKKEEMIGFGNMVMLFNILEGRIKTEGGYVQKLLEKLEKENFDKLDYIHKLQWAGIMAHIRNYNNPHGVKASDVDMGNHPNFQTASPQQDSEGVRNDLLSTPAGLARVLQEAEPDSEEYLFQNELPLSYYGSGIYLPPPITGSFEGLGADVENSVFVREGNGWIVGLQRAFDGRVKQLNYVYQELMLDRYNFTVPVMTYLPYKHPDFTAKGLRPEYVLNGSGKDVLAIGEWENSARLLVSPSNGTLDPNSHSFTEVNTSVLWSGSDCRPTNGAAQGATTIAKIGDWVYLIASYAEQGSHAGRAHPNYNECENFVQRFFRFPWSALFVPGKPVITPTPVNITYDNVDMVRKTNQRNVELCEYVNSPDGGVASYLCNFTHRLTGGWSHRRRQYVVVENPAVKNQARIKISCIVYWTFDNAGKIGGNWRRLTLNYNFDANTNTMTMAPGWVKPTLDDVTSGVVNYTDAQEKRFLDAGLNTFGKYVNGDVHCFLDLFAFPCVSWVPGFGYIGTGSLAVGGAPYQFSYLQLNESGLPEKDFESIFNDTLRFDQRGAAYSWGMVPPTPSPFGVANFPRMYSDIYEYNGKVNAIPIEQFTAIQENGGVGYFNRMTEGGTDNVYTKRPSFQSSFIAASIYGRGPNSKFGKTVGYVQDCAFRNFPQKRDKYSTTHSITTFHHRPFQGFWQSGYDILGPQLDPAKKRLRLPICYKWTYNENTKALSPEIVPDQTVVMTEDQYLDKIKQLIGSHMSTIRDMFIMVDLFPIPGARSGSVAESTITCVYNRSQDPGNARAVCASFVWSFGGVDPVTGYRLINITWTNDALSNVNGQILTPPYRWQAGNDNLFATSGFAITDDGYWTSVSVTGGEGFTVSRNRSEVYSFGPNPNDLATVAHSSAFIGTVGNMISFALMHDRRLGMCPGCPAILGNSLWAPSSFPEAFIAIDGKGIMRGFSTTASGGAMGLVGTGYVEQIDKGSGFVGGELCLQGATFVEGNWSFFINADVTVTFNGYTMKAYKRSFDLRDHTDVYRSQKFYLYVVAKGSAAEYELDNALRYPNGDQLLVAVITTSDLGIVTIERFQPFSIAGYPLIRKRDAGIPVSSGSLVEEGTYKFIKESELYNN